MMPITELPAKMRLQTALFLILFPLAAGAVDLSLPANAILKEEQSVALSRMRFPTGPWEEGFLPQRAYQGQFLRQAWTVEEAGVSSLQIIDPLETQLREAGYSILFTCETDACGGFDFRFEIDVINPPAMRVNLGDFRYALAERTSSGDVDVVSLLASQFGGAGYIQITQITGDGIETAHIQSDGDTLAAMKAPRVPRSTDGTLAAALEQTGRVVLDDLAFSTGAAELGDGPFASLDALARYLADHPTRRIALVGHTDTKGALEANIDLSLRRAAAVAERLMSTYSVDPDRLQAQGVGYLAPLVSNLTADGRQTNRRVEAVLTTTE